MDDTHMDNQPSLGSNKVLILVGVCFLFVFVGTFASHNNHNSTKVETESTMTRPLVPMSNEMIWKAMSRHYYFHHHHTHNFINYVSKRVVPSQPNDRHNWMENGEFRNGGRKQALHLTSAGQMSQRTELGSSGASSLVIGRNQVEGMGLGEARSAPVKAETVDKLTVQYERMALDG
ncbi:unnamed protein product [Cuscuta epithymum]|uniref:Transmembrane protein n=1 Tax=Cuscuta epithymum TaxID=186058 RepID=A0AAV0FYD6_9ASTE|nr:unnamed protein product [Cuscuta epithymum]CAH9140706.1 unnamed protein product [Cuscuta epithymum]